MLSFYQVSSTSSNPLPISSYAQFNTFSFLPIEDKSCLHLYVDEWATDEDNITFAQQPALEQPSIIEEVQQQTARSDKKQIGTSLQVQPPSPRIARDYCPLYGLHDKECIFYKWSLQEDLPKWSIFDDEAESTSRAISPLNKVTEKNSALNL